MSNRPILFAIIYQLALVNLIMWFVSQKELVLGNVLLWLVFTTLNFFRMLSGRFSESENKDSWGNGQNLAFCICWIIISALMCPAFWVVR